MGRSCWTRQAEKTAENLCYNSECLKKAHAEQGLERSLKVEIQEEVYESSQKEFEEIEQQNRMMSLIIATRAGRQNGEFSSEKTVRTVELVKWCIGCPQDNAKNFQYVYVLSGSISNHQ